MTNESKISTSQLYKNLFLRLWKLFVRPAEEWEVIKGEDRSFNGVLSDFALPLMGISTLATFLGYVLNYQGFNAEHSLKLATVAFVSLFGGLYLTFFIMGVVLSTKGLKRREVMTLSIYSSSVWYIVTFIIALFPELIGAYFIVIYSGYMIYKGMEQYLSYYSRNYQVFIAVLFFVLVHLIPFLIKYFLLKFITF